MQTVLSHCRLLSSFAALIAITTLASNAAADPSSVTPEQGYELGEMQHPRAMAMAGAQQAFGASTTAIYLNPANLALYKMYHLEAVATFSPEARRQSYGGAIADSSYSPKSCSSGDLIAESRKARNTFRNKKPKIEN